MLYLKRVRSFNECEMDNSTGELITWGQYYYEDDEDHFIISLNNYSKYKQKLKEERFDYTRLQHAQNEKEYLQELEKAEKQLFLDSIFKRKIAGKEDV